MSRTWSVPDPSPSPETAPGLDALGLTRPEQAVYTALVDTPDQRLRQLRERHPELSGLAEAVYRLVDLGLVTETGPESGGDRGYRAVAPDIALGALIRAQEAELRAARATIDELIADYRQPVAPAPGQFERVDGRRAVQARIHQLSKAAGRHVRYVETCPPLLPHRHDAQVQCRGVYASVPIAPADRRPGDPPGDDHLDCIRVVPAIPHRMYLSDDRLGLILTADGPRECAALILRPSTALDALSLLFEQLWIRGSPYVVNGSGDQHIAPDRLVALLMAGLTDDAIARQLGVSERTVQRHLAALMDRMGVKTRFQAGVQAALRARRGHGDTAAPTA